jgi:predicted O-methyltransferase YrrM
MRHFYQGIPGWFSFADVYADAVREAPATGAAFVEVGAWKGKSASFLAVEIVNSGKAIDLTVVDHWKGSDEPAHHADADVRAGTLYQAFMRHTRPVAHVMRALRMGSVEAAATFADRSLDLVLLDAGHSYEDVLADIAAWLPKLKLGAVMAGDDYNWSGVRQAIEEAFAGRIEVLGEGKGRHWRVRL